MLSPSLFYTLISTPLTSLPLCPLLFSLISLTVLCYPFSPLTHVSLPPSMVQLNRLVDVIVASPGRLMQHKEQGNLFLSQVLCVCMSLAWVVCLSLCVCVCVWLFVRWWMCIPLTHIYTIDMTPFHGPTPNWPPSLSPPGDACDHRWGGHHAHSGLRIWHSVSTHTHRHTHDNTHEQVHKHAHTHAHAH